MISHMATMTDLLQFTKVYTQNANRGQKRQKYNLYPMANMKTGILSTISRG